MCVAVAVTKLIGVSQISFDTLGVQSAFGMKRVSHVQVFSSVWDAVAV